MKSFNHLWILVIFYFCAANGATSPDSSDADVALIRNVLSTLPRNQTLYSSLLSPSPLSPYRLHEMARWLGRYPHWQYLPHNDLLSLMRWHNGMIGYHHLPPQIKPHIGVYLKPPGQVVVKQPITDIKPPGQVVVKQPIIDIKPQGQVVIKPPGQVVVKQPIKVDLKPPGQIQHKLPVQVETKPLEFSSWYRLWTEEGVGECGIPAVESTLKMSRIVGGNVAKPGNWPWMVSLWLKPFRQHWCAGVIISREWILTAAHCLYAIPMNRDPSKWVVRLGKFNTTAPNPTFEDGREQDFDIDKLLVHPDYKTHTVLRQSHSYMVPDNDIALIKLNRPALYTDWVKPLCLPSNDEVPETGQKCAISGWGTTEAKPFPGVLNEAAVPVYSYYQCRRFPGYRELVTKNNICAGFKEGKVDTCNGDSGGPLQCIFRNRWVIAGITSYGDAGEEKCGNPLRPGVYTKTVNFVEWIHSQIYKDYMETFSHQK